MDGQPVKLGAGEEKIDESAVLAPGEMPRPEVHSTHTPLAAARIAAEVVQALPVNAPSA